MFDNVDGYINLGGNEFDLIKWNFKDRDIDYLNPATYPEKLKLYK